MERANLSLFEFICRSRHKRILGSYFVKSRKARTVREIAEKVGLSKETVRRFIKETIRCRFVDELKPTKQNTFARYIVNKQHYFYNIILELSRND